MFSSMAKQNVRKLINALEVAEAVDFPLWRYDYVVSCRTKLQLTTGKKFASRTDRDKGVVTIYRFK